MKNNNLVSAGELSVLCEQLALAMKAGIPTEEAMDAVAEAFADSRCSAQIDGVRRDIHRGKTLANAFENSGAFEKKFCSFVRIGEKSGKTDNVLSSMASYYSWEDSVRTSIRNSVTYPTILALMLTAIIVVLLVKVMPVFDRVFANLGIDASSGMSAGMIIGEIALVIIAIVAVSLIMVIVFSGTGKRDGMMNFLSGLFPFVRRLRTKLSQSRFLSVMHIMISAGCDMDYATEMAAKSVSEPNYSKRAGAAAKKISSGDSFPDAAESENLFDPMDMRIVRFGNAAGCIDSVLEQISQKCRETAENTILGITAIIEPVLVAVLSVVIGGILFSVMLPLLQILSSMN